MEPRDKEFHTKFINEQKKDANFMRSFSRKVKAKFLEFLNMI